MKAAAHNLAAYLLKIAVRCNSRGGECMGIWRECLPSPHHRSVHGMDLFGNRIFSISIIVRSPYYTSNRKIWQSSYMHQLNHIFRVETTPNFNIAIHQSQATGCNCWSIMDCNSFLWTWGNYAPPQPLEVFLCQTKTSTNRSTPSHVRMVLRNFVLVGLVGQFFFGLLPSSSTRKHVCCLFVCRTSKRYSSCWNHPKLKSFNHLDPVKLAKIRQQMPWSTIILCVLNHPGNLTNVPPLKKSQNVMAIGKGRDLSNIILSTLRLLLGG